MARPRSVPREGDLFVTVCPQCHTKRLLKVNPGRRRDTICTSCLRSGKANTPPVELSEESIDRYRAGVSAARLASEAGIAVSTFLRALRRAGVQCRTMSDAIRLLDNTARLRGSLDMLATDGELSTRLSAGHQGVPLDEWAEFRSDHWARVRSSAEWDRWREQVYLRDGYHCVLCKAASTRANSLEPHHIHKKSLHPDRVFDPTNGVTLCSQCHRVVTGQEEAWAPIFDAMLA